MNKIISKLILGLILNASVSAQIINTRTQLFNTYKNSVFQVRAVNTITSQKASFGSGFVVGDGTYLATNYHVISNLTTRKNFRADYTNQQDKSGDLELVAVDVINDLALLKAKEVIGKPFVFAIKNEKGEALYSLGNPNDLGFVIEEGNNNGKQQNTAIERLLFSGSLNSGMSGGPTINASGEVVGVNAATQGNGIGFIVPVNYLDNLLNSVKNNKSIDEQITEQLSENNKKYYGTLFQNDFKKDNFAKFDVPSEIGNDIRCWDASREAKTEELLEQNALYCKNTRDIYISDSLNYGNLAYVYFNIYAQENMSALKFYELYSNGNSMDVVPRSSHDSDDFSCKSDFVEIADHNFKINYCLRPSKRYKDINDIYLLASSIGDKNQGFMIYSMLLGVQEEIGKNFFKQLLKNITLNTSELNKNKAKMEEENA